MLLWLTFIWSVAGVLLMVAAAYFIWKVKGGYISIIGETILVLICGPLVWLAWLIMLIDEKFNIRRIT